MRTPSPVWGPLAGEDAEERSSAKEGKAKRRVHRVPAGPRRLHAPFSQLLLLAGSSMGLWALAPTHGLPAPRLPGSPAPEQVAENCPSVAGVRGAAGVGTRGWGE